MTRYFNFYQPPTPAKELLLKFYRLERAAKKMLEELPRKLPGRLPRKSWT